MRRIIYNIIIVLLFTLFITPLHAQPDIDFDIVEADHFFVAMVKIKEINIVLVNHTAMIQSGGPERKIIEFKVEVLETFWGNIKDKEFTVSFIPGNSVLLTDKQEKQPKYIQSGPFPLSDFKKDSLMIMNLWNPERKYYTFESNSYDNLNYIRKKGKKQLNPYILSNDIRRIDTIPWSVEEIRTLYNIISLKEKEKRMQQLKEMKENTKNPAIREKCNLIMENNMNYGNDYGKPVNDKQ